MSIFDRFLTPFEREMLKEMEKPERWIATDYAVVHVAGFRYWVANMPFIDFGPDKLEGKVPTPKISGLIARFLLWKKYQYTLKPILDKQKSDAAYRQLQDEQDYVMKILEVSRSEKSNK